MKAKLFILSLSIIAVAFSSCTKETDDLSAKETENNDLGLPIEGYAAKIVSVSDKSGDNSISVKFYAETDEILEQHLNNWEYSIEPVFDEGVEKIDSMNDDTSGRDENDFKKGDIVTEVIGTNLASGVTGFVFNAKYAGLVLKSGYATGTWHHGPKWWHHAKVEWLDITNSNNGICAEFWTQYKWSSDWKKKETYILDSSNTSSEFSYSNYRIRVKVLHNWNNYAVYFKHWSTDDWTQYK